MPEFTEFYDFHFSTPHGRKLITIEAKDPLEVAQKMAEEEAVKQYGPTARIVTTRKSHRCPNCLTEMPLSQ